ncbi:MAG TPA: ABC transporter permease [Candidatus Nanoarchaeia archaeon]|nr:ABC transporter permease [Candidatus Nanoarchaeia archaeon]
MIQDLMKYIASNMMHRLTRSSLTILSVLIGIMAIFALVSFGQGLSRYVDQISQESGADKLIAQPKGFGPPGSSGIFLTENDLNTIKKTIGVSEATGMIAKQAEVKRKENEKGKWVYAMSMPTVSSEQRLIDEAFGGIGLLKGRNLKKGDKGKAILGFNYQLPDKIFDKPLKLGDSILINGQLFDVIGFYEEIGNPQDDLNIYMTKEDAKKTFDVDDEYAFIYIRAAEGVSPAKLASRLEEKLRKEKGQKEGEEDFFVQTYEQLIETFGTILVVLNSILVIIAGISIVVAAVNIMNTMYTAVLERTKEIGVMKSIGARNSTILFMFFFESGVLGLIGGALGVVLGYVIAKTGGAIAAAAGYALLKPYFPWWLTVGCLLFSFLIGACSGYFPARQAASLKPVDALRYE